MKKTFLLSCLMLAAMPVMAAYTGHVYVDKNKNGVFDQSEKPLAGIKVSDGLNVVETAADGSFTYPVMSVNVLFSLPLLRGIKHLTVIIIK